MKNKKIFFIVAVCTIMGIFTGCGADGKEPLSPEETTSAETELQAPEVSEFVRLPITDAVEIMCQWEPVENADGYEVSEESKYKKEESYRDAQFTETEQCAYTTGGQDEFDFRVKVRAFRGEGQERIYSQWSNIVEGNTWDTAGSAADDGQNPIMNFIGTYGVGRAGIDVQPSGKEGAKISIRWSGSAAEHSEWVMSGKLDTTALTVEYSDCVKKDVVYKEDGTVQSETVVYENGKGTIAFHDGTPITLTWNDEQEHIADGTVFEYSSYGGQ